MSKLHQTAPARLLMALGVAIASSTVASVPAQAFFVPSQTYSFTQGFDGYFGSTNGNGTGASATIDWTFEDTADGFLGLTLDITNTTSGSSLIDGFTTGSADTSKLVAFGFDWTGGDFSDLFSVEDYSGGSYFANLLDSSTTKAKDRTLGGGGGFNTAFDLGISSEDSLKAGGSPQDALAEGQSTSVTFKLDLTSRKWTNWLGSSTYTAENVGSFFQSSFESGDFRAAARFKDVGDNSDSDKLFGGILPESVAETPVDETPVDETPVDETPVDETPVPETPDGGTTGGGGDDGDVWATPVPEVPAPVGVPEPSMAIALLGLLGFSASRRRHS
jgi:hypothetical protein